MKFFPNDFFSFSHEFFFSNDCFFLRGLKWNILPNQSVFPSTRCTKEKTAKSTKYLQTEPIQKENKKINNS